MAKLSKKQRFLQDVRFEVESLKLNTTQGEKDNLDIWSFNPTKTSSCIYGQITKHCRNSRAHALMNLGCKRVWHTDFDGVKVVSDKSFTEASKNLNGEYLEQMYQGQGFTIIYQHLKVTSV